MSVDHMVGSPTSKRGHEDIIDNLVDLLYRIPAIDPLVNILSLMSVFVKRCPDFYQFDWINFRQNFFNLFDLLVVHYSSKTNEQPDYSSCSFYELITLYLVVIP